MKMTQNQLVSVLKKEAEADSAFKDTCIMFGSRERARNQVTVAALQTRMERHGFHYSKEKYASILKRMADLGLGRLETDSKGQVKALKNIETTLQSIGKAACGEASNLANWRKRNRFRSLPSGRTPAPVPKKAAPAPKLTMVPRLEKIDLVMKLNDKPVRLEVSNDLTAEEIAAIISKFQR